MPFRKFDIRLTLRGPILTKSSTPSRFGVDAAVARDADERPIIPGSLIKGRLREALTQLDTLGVLTPPATPPGVPGPGSISSCLDRLFGEDTQPDTGNEPSRGALIFGDLVSTAPTPGSACLKRVALDPVLGGAKGGMLRVIESPFAPGKKVVFEGRVEGYFENNTPFTADLCRRWLTLGFSWMTQVGSARTSGFGRVLAVQVTVPDDQPNQYVAPTVQGPGPAGLRLEIRPRGPLCITRHKIGGNLFESDDIIPGGMLAGAVMQTAKSLGLGNTIQEFFDRVRFRHAFPTITNARPSALPSSTVKVGAKLYDVARHPDPVLLPDDGGNYRAPQFPLDWKHRDDVLTSLGWAFPARELRVRTDIDAVRPVRRTANRGVDRDKGQLFSWEMIQPWRMTNPYNREAIVWRSFLDFGALDPADRDTAARAFSRVLSSLGFLSKTKASCEVVCHSLHEPELPPLPADSQTLVLVMQTPTLLVDPRYQTVQGVHQKKGAIGPAAMLRLYQSAWEDLSGGSLQLTHHFARQFLAGGDYLGIRFQRAKGKYYNPWLLTEAGSVFVFTITNHQVANSRLQDWLGKGLPLPQWASEAFGSTFDLNPYIPQNGCGEIAVHSPVPGTSEIENPLRCCELADPILPCH
jgi:hypothetical protein